MMENLKRTVVVLLLFIPTTLAQLQLSVQMRALNAIEIECRDGGVPVNDADFWIDDPTTPLPSRLDGLGVPYTYTMGGARISFTLQRELEGSYYCGNIDQGASSSPEEFVAYPVPVPVVDYHSVESGDSVTLPCEYPPGRLASHYSVYWRDGGSILAASRYAISPADFSLTINSTELSDENTEYVCVVMVDDPRTQSTNDWPVNSSPITLIVYEKPEIVSPPDNKVLLESEAAAVNFTCTATGDPVPTITWKLNGLNIDDREDSGRFNSYLIYRDDHTIIHGLAISQLTYADSGSIDCVAMNMVYTTRTGAMEFQKFTRTTLSVLTNNFVLQIGITTGSDLQVRASLSAPIQDVLNIRIRYINEEDKAVIEQQKDENFINTLDIFLRIPRFEIPYSTFRVQIAMVVNGVTGDYTPESDVYDKSVAQPLPDPDTCMGQSDDDDDDHVPLIVGVSAAGGLIVITLLVISAILIVFCSKRFTRKAEINKLIKLVERYKDDPETKRTLLGILEKRMASDSPEEMESQGRRDSDSEPPSGPVLTGGGYVQQAPPPPYRDISEDKSGMAETQFENGMELVMFSSEPRNLSSPSDPQHGTSEAQSSESPEKFAEKTTRPTDGPT